jgi:hypothetical protein
MRWFNKLMGQKAPAEQDHPKAPVMSIKGPKAYYEYSVQGTKDISWFARAYLPVKQEDGSFKTVVKEITSPADSVEVARTSAQAWGLKMIQEYTK